MVTESTFGIPTKGPTRVFTNFLAIHPCITGPTCLWCRGFLSNRSVNERPTRD
jgi:hypothetical protein